MWVLPRGDVQRNEKELSSKVVEGSPPSPLPINLARHAVLASVFLFISFCLLFYLSFSPFDISVPELPQKTFNIIVFWRSCARALLSWDQDCDMELVFNPTRYVSFCLL